MIKNFSFRVKRTEQGSVVRSIVSLTKSSHFVLTELYYVLIVFQLRIVIVNKTREIGKNKLSLREFFSNSFYQNMLLNRAR